MKNIYKSKLSIKKAVFLLSLFAALLAANLSLQAQITIQLGTGTTASANTEASPVNGYYNWMHYQTVYTAAEINAMGISVASTIDSIGYFVTVVPAGGVPNYRIRMANTTATNCAAYIPLGPLTTLDTVYTNAAPTWTAGTWNMK